MAFRRARTFASYKPGAIDGDKAKRLARSTLLNARSLDNITADSFARSYGLKLPTAEAMIADERRRRSAHG